MGDAVAVGDARGETVGDSVAIGVAVADDVGVAVAEAMAVLAGSSDLVSGGRTCGGGIKLKAIAAAAKLDTPKVAGTA